MEVCVPHSSTKTKRLGSIIADRSRKVVLASSSRSEATFDFFERPAPGQASDGPAHRGDRRRDAPGLLERLAVLLQRQVGVRLEVGRQPLLEDGALERRPPGYGLRLHVPGLAAALEPALDGRHRYGEGPGDLLPGCSVVDGGEHAQPEILRVRLHARRLARGSTLTLTAVVTDKCPAPCPSKSFANPRLTTPFLVRFLCPKEN